ncbi:MAG: DUF2092 domain-containing protein [bacterium]
MRNISRLSVRSLLLTAALAFALGAPAAAQEERPGKPPQNEEPEPAERPAPAEPEPEPGEEPEEKPAPEPEAPPAEEPEEEKPAEAAPPEAEPAPEEKPAEEARPEEEAISPKEEAINAAVEMSRRLAELEDFRVEASLVWEEVLENGEKILTLERVEADVARPHGLRMERTSAGRERILFYNGEQAVLWGPVTRYFATAAFTGTLTGLATHLADKYGYEIPLADLFMWSHEEGQIEAIKSANLVGQDLISGRVCDHYAYRQEGVDWQLWIDTGKGGLPCGYAITDLTDPARPLFLATVEIEPEAEFHDRRFTFDPPEDAAEIPLATTRRPAEEAAPEAEEAAPEPEKEAAPKEQVPPEEMKPEQEPAPEADKAPDGEETPEGEAPEREEGGEAPRPDAPGPKKEE